MARIGRNDPCPCGSGEKYKHCCQDKVVRQLRPLDPHGEDIEWARIRRTEGEVLLAIINFASSTVGERFFEESVEEFGIWGEYPVDQLDIETFFLPWVAFNWIPKSRDGRRVSPGLKKQPLALQYLNKNADRLSAYKQAFIVAACSQPFSFWAITDAVAGKSLVIRDIFMDRVYTVKEANASRVLKRGDAIFARVVDLDDQAIMVGLAPTILPPREHLRLLDLRDSLKKVLREQRSGLDLEQLHIADPQLRRAYLGIVESLRNPPRLELRNTDGDPLSFVTLYFELHCSPGEAFEGLKSLSLDEARETILEDSAHDEEGNLVEVSFDWHKAGNKLHKHWDNTVLGNITIKRNTLTAEVNSEKRAKKFRSEIKKRLGAKAVYRRAVHESVESKLEEYDERRPDDARRELEELQSLPEVRDLLKKEMESHWENWYHERIPALKNKTPIEAARTKGGRERLEALFCDFERRNEDVSDPHLRVDVPAMRKKLGL